MLSPAFASAGNYLLTSLKTVDCLFVLLVVNSRFRPCLHAWPKQILGVLLACAFTHAATPASQLPPLATVAGPAANILQATGSTSLIFIAVRGHDVSIQTFGETAPGSGQRPNANSLIRLCSVTKVFTTDLLTQLAADKQLRIDDPLQRFAPAGAHVPTKIVHSGTIRSITLLNLATHTAGLPREIGPAPPGTPHFTFPSFAQRWAWLQRHRLLTPPGSAALYSNVGFDFLADALQSAAQIPYQRLLAQRILNPLGMHDTTLQPTPEQCAHLLRGVNDEGPCTNTVSTDGSSGLYSTPADLARWLRYLVGDASLSVRQNAAAQANYLLPAQLVSVQGLNHAGRPSGIGLGWLRLGAPGTPSMILEKTGSGAGFRTYVALTPAEHTGIFLAFISGHEPWHADPFTAANNILLSLSNLPPMPVESPAHLHARRRTLGSARQRRPYSVYTPPE